MKKDISCMLNMNVFLNKSRKQLIKPRYKQRHILFVPQGKPPVNQYFSACRVMKLWGQSLSSLHNVVYLFLNELLMSHILCQVLWKEWMLDATCNSPINAA